MYGRPESMASDDTHFTAVNTRRLSNRSLPTQESNSASPSPHHPAIMSDETLDEPPADDLIPGSGENPVSNFAAETSNKPSTSSPS